MKWGLALSGGGIRGAAHVGVLQALEDMNLRPDFISGTSAGSIAAGLYACGYSSGDMKRICQHLDESLLDVDYWGIAQSAYRRIRRKAASVTGFLRGMKLEILLDRLTGGINISDLAMPIAIPAVDLISDHTVYFLSRCAFMPQKPWDEYCCEVKLSQAIHASCAIPMLFSCVNIGKYQLVDGGLLENLPIDILYSMGAERVLAVDLGAAVGTQRIQGIPEVGMESFRLLSHRMLTMHEHHGDLIIRPDTGSTGSFDFSAIPDCIRAGYDAMMEASGKLHRILSGGH